MFNYSKAVICIKISDLICDKEVEDEDGIKTIIQVDTTLLSDVKEATSKFGRTNRITELSRNSTEVCFEVLDIGSDWLPVLEKYKDKIEVLVVFKTDADLKVMVVDDTFVINKDKLRAFGVLITEDEVERVTLSVPDGRLRGFLIEEVI